MGERRILLVPDLERTGTSRTLELLELANALRRIGPTTKRLGIAFGSSSVPPVKRATGDRLVDHRRHHHR
jgi:hypothetical protein